MLENLILNTDSYKTSHVWQYPPDTRYLSAYIESRGGRFPHVLFFGLQMFIKKYLCTPVTTAHIAEAESFCAQHGVPFYKAGWEHIVNAHGGYLPLAIEAVPEGTLVPTQNVLVQVLNTDPACFWLPTYIETALLRAVWYPSTVATVSWTCKAIIARYLQETADNLDSLDFKLHDFGARGVSSLESAAIGGAAHLINFQGSDTIAGILQLQAYYNAPMAGFSIPAAEHSTITSWGMAQERQAYANILAQFADKYPIVAAVSDSYDIWNAIDNLWGGDLKASLTTFNGTVVIRLDSGNPVHVVCEAIERLMHLFGFTVNTKGYKMLPPFLRVLQGDGVNSEMIEAILFAMKRQQLSAENIVFGMGGELLQKINRDTLKFAMKASAADLKGQWVPVFKDPITDPGKRSKQGRLALIVQDHIYKTIRLDDLNGEKNLLQPVYQDGKLLHRTDLVQIRARAQQGLLG